MRVGAVMMLIFTAALCGNPLSRADDTAQRVARLGVVWALSESTPVRGLPGFYKRLAELGWVEGRNLTVERRWAEGQLDRFPALMAEMAERKVDVIVTTSTPRATAAKKATTTIPIVVMSMGDPVGTGLVPSLAHPGGNRFGYSQLVCL